MNNFPHIPDFSTYCFRSSSVGLLMTGDAKKEKLNEKIEKKQLEISSIKTQYEEKIAKAEEEISSYNKNRETKTFKTLEAKPDSLRNDMTQKILKISAEIKEMEAANNATIKLPLTCVKELLKIYILERYGIRKEIKVKYFQKGITVEEKSIELLSNYDDDFYVKNTQRIWNDYIQGECDIHAKAKKKVLDVKSSWDMDTFLVHSLEDSEEINTIYWWQGQCYMWLYNEENYELCYVLIDTPPGLVEDECRRALFTIGTNMDGTAEYEDICNMIHASSTFSHIDIRERVHKKYFTFDPEAIERLKVRIEECRSWLNEFAIKEFVRAYGYINLPEDKKKIYDSIITSKDMDVVVEEKEYLKENEETNGYNDIDPEIDDTSREYSPEEIKENVQYERESREYQETGYVEPENEDEEDVEEIIMRWFYHDETEEYIQNNRSGVFSYGNKEGLIEICVVESGDVQEAIDAHNKMRGIEKPDPIEPKPKDEIQKDDKEISISESNYKSFLEKLTSVPEAIELFQKNMAFFKKNPNIMEELKSRRAELENKPKSKPEEKPKPAEKTKSPEDLEKEIIKKCNNAKYTSQIREIYQANKEFIDSNIELRNTITAIGKTKAKPE